MTNREKIEAMTVKEFCKKFDKSIPSLLKKRFIRLCDYCIYNDEIEYPSCDDKDCNEGCKMWLDQEAKDEKRN